MQTKLKMISYYFSMLVLSLLILLLFLISFFHFTLLKPEYVIHQLEKNHYYQKLSKDIQEEMSNYIIQAGLDESVLENLYTQEEVTKTVNSAIKHFYNNQEIKIDITGVKNNLENNILNYLKKHNLEATDQNALDQFVEQIIKIYDEKIRLSRKISTLQRPVHKVMMITKISILILIITTLLFSIFCLLFYKKTVLSIPCFTSAILLFLGDYLLFQKINVKYILFWNKNISQIIKSILWDLSSLIKYGALALIILGSVYFIIYYFIEKKFKKKK